jgi:hypothetical protein
MSLKRFAFIAGGDVFSIFETDPDNPEYGPNAPRIAAGLQSNPTVVEITDNPEVTIGSAWDGTTFTPAQNNG